MGIQQFLMMKSTEQHISQHIELYCLRCANKYWYAINKEKGSDEIVFTALYKIYMIKKYDFLH